MSVILEACRTVAGLGLAVPAVVSIEHANPQIQLGTVDIRNTAAGSNLISGTGNTAIYLAGVYGLNPNAGITPLMLANGAMAFLTSTVTMTGTTPGSDVQVDGGTAFPIADATTMGVVGAQNGTFQHSSVDNASPATINKFSGFCTMGAVSTVLVINNSLADVGDHVELTPTNITAVRAWSAVATLNTITITSDVVPGGAGWTFGWKLTKSTV